MKLDRHVPVLMIERYLTSEQVPSVKCSLNTRANKGSMKWGKVQSCLISSIVQCLNICQLFSK